MKQRERKHIKDSLSILEKINKRIHLTPWQKYKEPIPLELFKMYIAARRTCFYVRLKKSNVTNLYNNNNKSQLFKISCRNKNVKNFVNHPQSYRSAEEGKNGEKKKKIWV